MGSFSRPGLEVMNITYFHVDCIGYSALQGRLGKVIKLLVQEEALGTSQPSWPQGPQWALNKPDPLPP